jgi:hypothetical protein
MLLIFTSTSLAEKIPVRGKIVDADLVNADPKDAGREVEISKAIVTAIQGGEKFEQSTTDDGRFELFLNPGVTNITYRAPGYGKLEDRIIVANGMEEITKRMHRDSVNGWSTIMLLIPGVFGLLVACIKEYADRKKVTNSPKRNQNRMLVALANGIVWAIVLAWIWHYASSVPGVTKIQFFHSSLAFEFFVPLLGYLGSLLFVFDLFRGRDNDSFKDKEFGMRIIMGPYVAMVIVALFGKEFDFVNLQSDTGQGVLAFISGLIVVVAIQGIIERANEMLGKWRRKNDPYLPSPLAKMFNLSEIEDKELSKASLRHPEQLLMLSVDDLKEKQETADIDKNLVLALKRKVELEQLKSEISDLIWNRLKPKNISTIQDFSTLSDGLLKQVAQETPELSDRRLKQLRAKTIKFIDNHSWAV